MESKLLQQLSPSSIKLLLTKLLKNLPAEPKLDAAYLKIHGNLVHGLDSTQDNMGTGNKGHKQCDRSFANMLLADFATITNLHPVLSSKIVGYQRARACALARCTLLLLGSDALTPSIIQRVWGANNTILETLGGPHGDLALT
jgi:hypothetical protein